LRSLLVFVLLVSIGMSWLAVRMERARKQREAVEAIRRGGGEVGYEAFGSAPSPYWNHALIAIFGDDFLLDVNRVFCTKSFGDDEMKWLNRLTDLERFSAGHTQISDVGLERIGGLTRLKRLYLNGTQVTDAGLEHLEGLSNLRRLDLRGTRVTPEGVAKLQEALPGCVIEY
ncbi:hypothetical protein ACFL5Q_07125, partial [Planctomycetota bacterium]